MHPHRTIDPAELHALARERPITLIDVRTPAEYAAVHAPGAVNLPLDALDPSQLAHVGPEDTVYVTCRSGARAARAIDKLRAAGYRKLVNVQGGTDAWVKAGLPVERGRETMSLERQVRIAAGAFTLLGVALAFWQPLAGLALAGFVGAGMMIAGITDSCAMGLLLAKMPWNKVHEGVCAMPSASGRPA